MITVSILINGQPVFTRSATNITPPENVGSVYDIYEVDTGEIIKHVPDEGVVVLAKKLLDTIVER